MFYLGAQGVYPPQYPPPYPGSAVENAPPLATKSDDYNRQSAYNPNIWKNKPESLISHFEMMADGKWYSVQSSTLVIFFVKVLFWRESVIHTYMTCIIIHFTCTVRIIIHTTVCFWGEVL